MDSMSMSWRVRVMASIREKNSRRKSENAEVRSQNAGARAFKGWLINRFYFCIITSTF